ncbi:M14 family metallopeptidase [Salinarimonas soli]|uniref:Peptidase M14 domain-containing protein n=1 Tax=Salinarimonas soli TaxID=1638099 RepID=A0A5B2V9N3_9HYPH|nr:M14 family metallocarboxypeptidase [Salinarimonas soli]KAA2235721.1 hypothetical protein F0L46_18005 [Salinarimonas soli]
MPPRFLLAAAIALVAAPTMAQTGPARGREYRQAPAVLERYGDVPIALTAPALAPGRAALTAQDEMLAFLRALKERHPEVTLSSLGRSIEGRDIPFLVFTAEGAADAAGVRALPRPIVWLIGQQHGNEPAGGEAMLAVAHALAGGELKPLLDRVSVVVVPRANPDGAAADMRVAANGLDPNRDHLLLTLPEIRAIHARMVDLPPDVVVDHHEFQVAGTWLARFGGLQKSDAMLLSATHPQTPAALSRLAGEVFLPAIAAGLRERGLTSFVYHTATGRADRRTVSLGGNAPGISRNNFGLAGALSFLVETRGIGIGMEGYQRRVATHYLAAKAVLERAAADPAGIRAATAAARAGLAADPGPLVVAYSIATVPETIPLVDPVTGADKPVPVDLQDSRRTTVTATRPRPAGYLLEPAAAPAIQALRLRGAVLCRLGEGGPVPVEAFRVAAKAGPVNRESINPDGAVAIAVEPRGLAPSPDALFVPMAQPLSAVIAAALEPDSPGSHVGVGLVPVSEAGEPPVYRVPARPPLAPGGPSGCDNEDQARTKPSLGR